MIQKEIINNSQKKIFTYLKEKYSNEYIASRSTIINFGKLVPSIKDFEDNDSNFFDQFETDLKNYRDKYNQKSITKVIFDNQSIDTILIKPKNSEKRLIIYNNFVEQKEFNEEIIDDDLLNIHYNFNKQYNKENNLHHYFIQPNFPKVNLTYTFILLITKELNLLELKELTAFVSQSAIPIIENHILNHAIKAAKAAIMARNISHNLGSHVIFYIKDALESFQLLNVFPHLAELEHLGEKTFSISVIEDITIELKTHTKTEENVTAPFLRGLIHFLNYIQERHDYIASISNNHTPYLAPVNYKDYIFDVLLPDKKIERHLSDDLEKYNKYKSANLLLDYISKSEKIKRDDIDIFFKKTGKEAFNANTSATQSATNESLMYLKKMNLSLPSGIMGRQAFFSIFENFIRNSAKHKQEKDEKKMEIYFEVDETKEENDFYTFKLYDKQNKINQTVYEKLIDAKYEDYIEDDGVLKETNKGIKEMRISAAFLRDKKVEDIDEQNVDYPGDELLKILLLDDEENELTYTEKEHTLKNSKTVKLKNYSQDGILCYQFKIPKSKKCVFISNNNNATIQDDSIDIKTPEEYKKGLKNYNLVVVDNNIEDPQSISAVSSTRILKNVQANTHNFEALYKQWIDHFFNIDTDDYTLAVEDDKIKDEKSNNKLILSKKSLVYKTIKQTNKNYIFFRTHNDTEDNFEAFIEQINKAELPLSFVEGISGHNSTDRLIRYENQDEYWRLKLIESALAKITIIDERIYDKYAALNEEITLSDEVKDAFFDKLNQRNRNSPETKKDLVEDFKKLYPIEISEIDYAKKVFAFIKDKDNYDTTNLKYFFYKYIDFLEKNINRLKTESVATKVLRNKNINIYNLMFSAENNTIELLDSNKKTVEVTEKSHFIFIHHTLLENVAKTKNGQFDEAIKFIKETFKLATNGRLIVHSGRSRPDNLPEGVGFVQFSSLEAALKDCKFALSELAFNTILYKKTLRL